MDPHFQELAKQIADDVVQRIDGVVVKRLGEAEKGFDDLIVKRLGEAEKRLSDGAKMNMEELRTATKLAAESYGATLERIERELKSCKTDCDARFEDHNAVLDNHRKRITALEQDKLS